MDFLLLSAARHTNLLKAFMSQFEVFIIMIFGVFQNIFYIWNNEINQSPYLRYYLPALLSFP